MRGPHGLVAAYRKGPNRRGLRGLDESVQRYPKSVTVREGKVRRQALESVRPCGSDARKFMVTTRKSLLIVC
jgi:hypothetical protein